MSLRQTQTALWFFVCMTSVAADDTPSPPPSATSSVPTVRLGVLLPQFGTRAAGYSAVNWSPRFGVYQALREINNKSDGVADDLLPFTRIEVAYADSKCDRNAGLAAALHLTSSAFQGQGVSAIIGAGCSDATVVAAQVAGATRIPIVSPSATSGVLSDGDAYPYFLRTVPTDAIAALLMVELLQVEFNYTSIALVHSTDEYAASGGNAVTSAAFAADLAITTTQRFSRDEIDFSAQQLALQKSLARVIILYCQASDGARFLRTASEVGLGGEGFLYLGSDSMVDATLWESDASLSSNLTLRARVLQGFFSVAIG
eukprot:6258250-Prymnesium_polylepis.1